MSYPPFNGRASMGGMRHDTSPERDVFVIKGDKPVNSISKYYEFLNENRNMLYTWTCQPKILIRPDEVRTMFCLSFVNSLKKTGEALKDQFPGLLERKPIEIKSNSTLIELTAVDHIMIELVERTNDNIHNENYKKIANMSFSVTDQIGSNAGDWTERAIGRMLQTPHMQEFVSVSRMTVPKKQEITIGGTFEDWNQLWDVIQDFIGDIADVSEDYRSWIGELDTFFNHILEHKKTGEILDSNFWKCKISNKNGYGGWPLVLCAFDKKGNYYDNNEVITLPLATFTTHYTHNGKLRRVVCGYPTYAANGNLNPTVEIYKD